ncbi:MAG: hypothetical protein ACYTGG_09135 [Planctomycetota bacterium]|jgi:hypothetical protein
MFFIRLVSAQPQRGRETFPFPAFTRVTLPRAGGTSLLRPPNGVTPVPATGGGRSYNDRASRRMDDLARQHNCLGYFDDGDDDRPRAA